MADVTKIVSHVLNVPGEENVLVNYTDGTEIKFSLKEWQQIISKGKEALAFIKNNKNNKKKISLLKKSKVKI